MGSGSPGLSPHQLCSLPLTLALPHHHGPAKDHWTRDRSCQDWPWSCLITTDLPGEFDFELKYWCLPFPAPFVPVLGCPLALGMQRANDFCCSLTWYQPLLVPSNKRMKLRDEWQAQKSLLKRESVSQHPCHH